MKLNSLHKRILKICYNNKISHISCALNVVDILDDIYSIKKEDEPVILSCGHCFLGLAVVLEKYYGINAENLYKKNGLHPKRNINNYIYCSSGSLGQGITISCGMAICNKNRNVYCLISDGECDSGATLEALRFKHDYTINNLNIYVICNGTSALKKIDTNYLKNLLYSFSKDIIIKEVLIDIPILEGIQGHYKILNKEEYDKIINEKIQ